LGISPNITFLHVFEPKDNKIYNEKKFIGFRYYENEGKTLNSKYFTLIKRYDSKFYILEKNEVIKDIDNNSFFNKDLDCFALINNIIIKKYKNQGNTMNGETFPEIIGFCYGLYSLKKFNKNLICIEPLIPNVFDNMSLPSFWNNIN
jgi:hypothetical protein